jgi:valyl-tRNA synthetase
MLDKTYHPELVEKEVRTKWEEKNLFSSKGGSGNPWTVMMPPPNVTGSLHMGHALNMTLQDVLTRYYRMKGRKALWQPGMDHAGIATQMVVERQLAEEGTDRRSLGRENFVQRVWEWKAESGGTIGSQLRRLGASTDWARERFTLDEGLSTAVRKVFVSLYRDGLIYRDKRLVNWDCELLTAISDLEVEQREIQGHLWYFNYPIEGQGDRSITVATTRPETMLGDTGVAVHPEDSRYRNLIGQHVILPIVGRRIPIVADEHSDPEKGTGAVKITPAHDFNDFEVGKRHDLEAINILDSKGCLNELVPEPYRGLERYEARKKIVEDLQALGLVESIEEYTHSVPFGDRSNTVIEPWLTDQWYVDAKVLAKPAIEAVVNGQTKFIPKNWENTYFEWMNNIQPWCISRQLWWGHRIPAWFGPNGKIFVAMDVAEAQSAAQAHYGRHVTLSQDEDVLDTWFSSALWPFSTLGWPESASELEQHYPGDVLVTGFDIIFFWVARMMMMGIHFMGQVPFSDIYIHALVRDEKGQKMSKSKGNIIDPVQLMDLHGTDALRFTLAAMAAQGRDIKLAEQRVIALSVNRWLVGNTLTCASSVEAAIESYRFNEAADALYHFIWGTFCDWYVELVKPVFYGEEGAAKEETKSTFAWALVQVLHLLHPIAPFVTESLFKEVTGGAGDDLMCRPWPVLSHISPDTQAGEELDWVVDLVGQIRSIRAQMHVPAAAEFPLYFTEVSGSRLDQVSVHENSIKRLAKLSKITALDVAIKDSVKIVINEATFYLSLGDVIDLQKEKERLVKEIAKADQEVEKLEKKLANGNFVLRAPPEIVSQQKDRLTDNKKAVKNLQMSLDQLVGG